MSRSKKWAKKPPDQITPYNQVSMNYSAAKRWSAARHIFELCPHCADYIDICMNLLPGKTSTKAKKEGWPGSEQGLLSKRKSFAPETGGWFSDAVSRITNIVSGQISAIESLEACKGASDEVVKLSAVLTKSLAAIEELRAKVEKAANAETVDDQDVLEIHRRIIEKIDAAIDKAETKPISGGSGP